MKSCVWECFYLRIGKYKYKVSKKNGRIIVKIEHQCRNTLITPADTKGQSRTKSRKAGNRKWAHSGCPGIRGVH